MWAHHFVKSGLSAVLIFLSTSPNNSPPVEHPIQNTQSRNVLTQSFFDPNDYFVSVNPTTWAVANKDCERLFGGYGELLSIESEQELDFIIKEVLATDSSASEFWTSGLYDPTIQYYKWINGKMFEYYIVQNWGVGYPTRRPTPTTRATLFFENRFSFWFQTQESTRFARYICERVESIPTRPTEPTTPTTPTEPTTPSTENPTPSTPSTENPTPSTPSTENPTPSTPSTENPTPSTPSTENPTPSTPSTQNPTKPTTRPPWTPSTLPPWTTRTTKNPWTTPTTRYPWTPSTLPPWTSSTSPSTQYPTPTPTQYPTPTHPTPTHPTPTHPTPTHPTPTHPTPTHPTPTPTQYPTPTPTPSLRCHDDQDLVVVLDNNLSVDSGDYIKALDFIGKLLQEWQRQRRHNRHGFVVYSSPAHWRFGITNAIDVNVIDREVMSAVSVSRDKGRFTDRGLRTAFNFLESYFKIDQRRNILLITNGETDGYQPTIDVSNQIWTKGIRTFAIGVGELGYYPFEDELYKITGRTQNHVFRVDKYEQLQPLVIPVLQKICN